MSEEQVLLGRVRARSGEVDYAVDLQAGRHRLVADEPASHGGANAGPGPFTLLLSGLAACTAITLRMYAERKRLDLGTVAVSLAMHRTPEGNRIERRVTVSSTLTAEQEAKLAEICEKTPVTLALKSGVRISTAVGAVQQ